MNMNSTIIDVYNRMYPELSRDVAKCTRLAMRVEDKVAPQYTAAVRQYIENLSEEIFAENFVKKRNFISECLKYIDCAGFGEALAQRLDRVRSPKKFFDFYDNLDKETNIASHNCTDSLSKSNSIYFRDENSLKKLVEIYNFFAFKVDETFQRFFSKKSVSDKIAQAEQRACRLGLAEARFANNEEQADVILSALKLAKSNGDLLPQRVFVSDYIERDSMTSGVTYGSAKNSFISIASQRLDNISQNYIKIFHEELEKMSLYRGMSELLKKVTRLHCGVERFSVESPLAVMMHELGHVNQPQKLPVFDFLKLNERDSNAAFNLTEYLTRDDLLPELFAELYAKMRINGLESLSSEELRLLDNIKQGNIVPRPLEKQSSNNIFTMVIKMLDVLKFPF